ncbi:aldehyde dehydrogenase family protein [Streptomyces violaceusniger]|uniref:Aldehyde dehydrogenase n=1 Tax=Streptomyces violaceusniger TaxID=68280 RepID=A0A4D4LCL4_STRVO|nr:aldehyde dehydrogenase [Streptomyces violaceusniger]
MTQTAAPALRMFIDGRLVAAEGTPLDVLDPATEELAGQVPDATDAQLESAIEAAGRAFTTWSAAPLEERRAVLRSLAAVIREHTDELALLLTAEQGKPLEAAHGELRSALHWCEGIAEMEFPAEEIRDTGTHRIRIRHVPLGVVAGLVPWNVPLALAIWKIAPALLTGNTIVVKPSPFTPLTTLRIGELLAEADAVPAGVLNIVSGGDHIGPKLSEHPGIRKIAFTGSTATGKKVMASAARNLARVTLELGGNDAAIVLPDIDVDTVAEKLFWACFMNTGQVCVAAKRVYVHDDVYDAFARRFAEVAAGVKVGDGRDEGVQLGPLQNRVQYEKVVALIEATAASGARFLVKGDIPDGPGYFVHPTVVDDPADDSDIVRLEPFGPVVPLLRFHDIDEVVERANASEYGLGGSVWSGNPEAAERIATRIETGVVWINEGPRLAPDLPFGGHKTSGLGVENGTAGLLEYTDTQVLWSRTD